MCPALSEVSVLIGGIVLLGGDFGSTAVFEVEVDALDAVITAFTAAVFAFGFDAFPRHVFFWPRFPWPGPGMSGGGG